MPVETAPKGLLLYGCLILLVALTGLCTIFASVVTAIQAWQEHAQAQWPQVTSNVGRCAMVRTSSGRRQMFYIRYRLIYAVGEEQNATNIYSRNVPSPEIWQYPPNQIAPFQ